VPLRTTSDSAPRTLFNGSTRDTHALADLAQNAIHRSSAIARQPSGPQFKPQDPSDRRRMARTANQVVGETREAHDAIGDVPAGSIVVAGNGTGDLLLLARWRRRGLVGPRKPGETGSVVLDSS
jgi:hypothetical protein